MGSGGREVVQDSGVRVDGLVRVMVSRCGGGVHARFSLRSTLHSAWKVCVDTNLTPREWLSHSAQ